MSGKKKFFGIGLLALLTTAYFTSSCSRDDLSSSMIDAKAEAFNEVFIETYGTPNPQHDWGFGDDETLAFTRTENANANEWADPNKAYGGLKVPPKLTPDQIAIVKKYFQSVKDVPYNDPQWTHYFIQQVYKGHSDPMTGTNPAYNEPYSPEEYMAANGTTLLYASDYMDHLAAINGTFVDHINNFNHGDCGENDHVLDNGGNANDGPFHTDKIMYMYNSTTASFGYFNSNGSLCHTNYTGLVSWETIRTWARNNNLYKEDILNDGWNRSFMGFDFEQMIDDQCYATKWVDGQEVAKYFVINEYSAEYYINGEKTSNYTYIYNSQPVRMLSDQMNRYCADVINVDDSQLYSDYRVNGEYLGKQLNTDFIDGLLADGYLPVDNKSLRVWAKVGGCADGYYSDWIVTLTEAKRQDGGDIPTENADIITVQEIIDGRIFCEDLGSSDNSDIDYNDVVFDAFTYVTKTYKVPYTLNGNDRVYDYNNKEYLGYTYNKTDINLLAAGGTIAISAAGQDVNQKLGIGQGIMANTYVDGVSTNNSGYSNFLNNVPPVKFTVNNPNYINLRNIPIVVKYGTEVIELQAIKGSVPQKFLAPVGTPWIPERVEIQNGFPNFRNWVTTIATPWGDLNSDFLYNLKFVSNSNTNQLEGTSISGYDIRWWEPLAMTVKEDNLITITLENGQSLQEGDQIAITGYRENDDNAAGTLYIKCNGNVVAQTQDYNNIKYNANPNTFVFSVPSDMAGYNSFQLSKDLNGAEIYITGVTVIGGLGAQIDNSTSSNNGGNNNGGNNNGGNGGNGNNTTPPTVNGPSGHSATWSGSEELLADANGNWSGIDFYTTSCNDLANMGAGSYVRVYGYGTTNDWAIQICRQKNADPWTWTNIDYEGGSTPYVSTVIEFGPFNAEDARAIKLDGKFIVQGKNFVVKYIDIDNSGVTPSTSDEIVLWSSTEGVAVADQGTINLSNTKNIGTSGTLRFYLTHTGRSGQITAMCLDGYSVLYSGGYSVGVTYGENKDFALSEAMCTKLKEEKQIKLAGQDLVVTAVTYIPPAQ